MGTIHRLRTNDPELISLSFRYQGSIFKENLFDVADALKVNTTLTHLNFFAVSIPSDQLTALTDALYVNTTMTHLSIQCSPTDEKGIAALAGALSVNSSLTHLDLYYSFSSPEAILVIDAIANNTSISRLDLFVSTALDEMILRLAYLLQANTTLNILNLGSAMINFDVLASVADALHDNTTLTTLKLDWCQYTGPQMTTVDKEKVIKVKSQINEYIERNKRLRTFKEMTLFALMKDFCEPFI